MLDTTPAKHKTFAILLIAVFIAAQWVGLKHRIVHGQNASTIQTISASKSALIGNWDDKVPHSCAAFEAGTVGAALASPCFKVPIVPNLPIQAQWIAFASWQAPHTSHFSSRAPPA